jgi:hypothetical protein
VFTLFPPQALGLEAFAGEGEAAATGLVEWMSAAAWNAGLAAAGVAFEGAVQRHTSHFTVPTPNHSLHTPHVTL